MPKIAKKKVSRKNSKHRSSSKKSRRVRKTRVNVHTFKGIINGGSLSIPAFGTAINTWGGLYVWDMATLPIYTQMQANFEFARLNRVKFEFLPRYNMAFNASGSTTGSTLIVGIDEIPFAGGTTASTWGATTSEDTGVTEARAYASVFMTPDYIRGLESSTEVETLKKITKSFVPASYVEAALLTSLPGSLANAYEQRKAKWMATSTLGASALSVTTAQFWGCMYAFGSALASGSPAQVAYDVKIHYSVSFKRIRGV